MNNKSYYNLDNGNILREVIVKIGLERINTQEGVREVWKVVETEARKTGVTKAKERREEKEWEKK